MKGFYIPIIAICVVISSFLMSSPPLLPSVHAQAAGSFVAPFDFQLDQSAVDGKRYSYVGAGGTPNAIIRQGQNVTLPVIILPDTDKPVLVRFDATVDNNQTAPPRLPRGVHAVIEPPSVLVKPKQNSTIGIVVSVDKNAPDGKYALNIVGEWQAENGFVGSSIILHIGRDFGPDAMPFNALWSPLKQYESGIDSQKISCQSNFVLLIKYDDGSPACVNHDTAEKLVKRGWAIQEPKTYHMYYPGKGFPVLNSGFEKIVSGVQEAESIVGYHIGTPSYLPPGYSIQDILVENSNPSTHAKILASDFPLTQNTTNVEFIDKGGILIYTEPTSTAFNLTSWTKGWLEQNPDSTQIKIDGYGGVVNDITKGKRFDEDIDVPAQVVVFGKGKEVEIVGFIHSSELIRIAQSMLENQK